MRAQTEELLYVLLWTADSFMRPTWHNMTGSFEEWAWHHRLARRLAELEQLKLLERSPRADLRRVVRLTQEGARVALGGRDPVAQWNRAWDGRWRMVLFDLPVEERKLRAKLWRTLRHGHFGYLQDSVWISPDSAEAIRVELHGIAVRPDAFLIMEGQPAAGESDAEIVGAAWNFALINRGHEQYLRFARGAVPRGSGVCAWARRENALWKAAVGADPLLPAALLPNGYLGREAFTVRSEILRSLRPS